MVHDLIQYGSSQNFLWGHCLIVITEHQLKHQLNTVTSFGEKNNSELDTVTSFYE